MIRSLSLVALTWCAAACGVSRPVSSFERHLIAGRWEDAAAAFARDSALAEHADALHSAAMLHALPERDTYDPERAAELLQRFLERFPTDRRVAAVRQRLALVGEIVALRAELRALKAIDLGRSPRD